MKEKEHFLLSSGFTKVTFRFAALGGGLRFFFTSR